MASLSATSKRPTHHVIPALERFLSEFNSTLAAIVLHKDVSMCKICVRSVEKLQRLETELRKKQGEIDLQIENVAKHYGLCRRVVAQRSQTEAELRTSEKRTHKEAELTLPLMHENVHDMKRL